MAALGVGATSVIPISYSFWGQRYDSRIIHEGNIVPEELISQMFGSKEESQEEGMSLLVCRKLLKLMNGDVRYLREENKAAFILSAELAAASKAKAAKS